MDKDIQSIMNSRDFDKFRNLSRAELEFLRMIFALHLFRYTENNDRRIFSIVKMCSMEDYSFLTYLANMEYDIQVKKSSSKTDYSKINRNVCRECNMETCIKNTMMDFFMVFKNGFEKLVKQTMLETSNGEEKNEKEIVQKDQLIKVRKLKDTEYLEIIDSLLGRQPIHYNSEPNNVFFDKVKFKDLIYVKVMLKAGFIKYNFIGDNNYADFSYLDVTSKSSDKYYSNIVFDYFKEGVGTKNLKLDLNHIEDIYNEPDDNMRVFKIAAYYKYLIDEKRIDILGKLETMLSPYQKFKEFNVRNTYYINHIKETIDNLHVNSNTKEKLNSLLNYSLNYYIKPSVFKIPFNILIYTEDFSIASSIANIIFEFLGYFGYFNFDRDDIYERSFDDITIDRFNIMKLYNTTVDDKIRRIRGMLLIKDFTNILFMEETHQDIVLNVLSEDIDESRTHVSTVICGNKESLNKILNKNDKLSQMFNIILDVDEMDEEQVYNYVVQSFEYYGKINDEIKSKLKKYIASNYKSSDIKGSKYADRLIDRIVLNQNSIFDEKRDANISIEAIPPTDDVKDIQELFKDLNELVGLEKIKSQIRDWVSLLKFNKRTNINIKDFNLNMIFEGNPGTGKTTIARLLTGILYNLEYIPQYKYTEVTAKDLIASYVGQTSGKTYGVIRNALGGVLFIDEAYSLLSYDGENSFGEESLATIIKAMEDYKDRLVIIFAGYKNEMENFIKRNPGMLSRVGYKMEFKDYSIDELMEIFNNLVGENNMTITKEAFSSVKDIVKNAMNIENFGNARYIHNLFQKIIIEHAKNNEDSQDESNLYEISLIDINKEKLLSNNDVYHHKIGFV